MRMPALLLLLGLASSLAYPSGSDWKPFAPKDGAFSVLLPGTPTEHKKSISTASGQADMSIFELVVQPGEGKYVVGVSEFAEHSIKPGTEDKRLDNARDAAVTGAKG